MKIQTQALYAHKADPIVFRKINKNVTPFVKINRPKKGGMDLKG